MTEGTGQLRIQKAKVRNVNTTRVSASGYILGAGAVPGIDSDRHRLLGSLYGGIGSNLDGFSATRIGGGVLTMGEEHGSTWRPVLPGSSIQEYFPKPI